MLYTVIHSLQLDSVLVSWSDCYWILHLILMQYLLSSSSKYHQILKRYFRLPAKGKTLHFSWMMNWNILFSLLFIRLYFQNSDLIIFHNILISKTQVSKFEYAQCAKLIHALGKLSWKFCGKIFHHKYLDWFFFFGTNCQMVKIKQSL